MHLINLESHRLLSRPTHVSASVPTPELRDMMFLPLPTPRKQIYDRYCSFVVFEHDQEPSLVAMVFAWMSNIEFHNMTLLCPSPPPSTFQNRIRFRLVLHHGPPMRQNIRTSAEVTSISTSTQTPIDSQKFLSHDHTSSIQQSGVKKSSLQSDSYSNSWVARHDSSLPLHSADRHSM